MSRSKWVARRQHRFWVWLRGRGSCFYCRKPIAYEDMSLDHVLPKHRGHLRPLNSVPACLTCNQAKGGEYPSAEDYSRFISEFHTTKTGRIAPRQEIYSES